MKKQNNLIKRPAPTPQVTQTISIQSANTLSAVQSAFTGASVSICSGVTNSSIQNVYYPHPIVSSPTAFGLYTTDFEVASTNSYLLVPIDFAEKIFILESI